MKHNNPLINLGYLYNITKNLNYGHYNYSYILKIPGRTLIKLLKRAVRNLDVYQITEKIQRRWDVEKQSNLNYF